MWHLRFPSPFLWDLAEVALSALDLFIKDLSSVGCLSPHPFGFALSRRLSGTISEIHHHAWEDPRDAQFLSFGVKCVSGRLQERGAH